MHRNNARLTKMLKKQKIGNKFHGSVVASFISKMDGKQQQNIYYVLLVIVQKQTKRNKKKIN